MSLKFTISIQNHDSLTYADDIFVPKLEVREGNFKKLVLGGQLFLRKSQKSADSQC